MVQRGRWMLRCTFNSRLTCKCTTSYSVSVSSSCFASALKSWRSASEHHSATQTYMVLPVLISRISHSRVLTSDKMLLPSQQLALRRSSGLQRSTGLAGTLLPNTAF